jgi:hypothetical protein
VSSVRERSCRAVTSRCHGGNGVRVNIRVPRKCRCNSACRCRFRAP